VRSLAALLIVCATATVATAQQAATDPDDADSKSAPSAATYLGTARPATVAVPVATAPAIARDPDARLDDHYQPHPPAGIGGDLAIGWAGQRNGPRGYVVRFEYELFPVFERMGGVFGFNPGFEWWRSGDDNWGFSVPFTWEFGARVSPFRSTLGVGFDTFLIDQVDDDTGFGMFAPLAVAKLGLDVGGVELAVDGRIGYRWQFGAADHARWQLGISIGHVWEGPKQPIR